MTPNDDRGPRLSYASRAHIVARCPSANRVLLGGLGAFGVGQMWSDEEEHHKTYRGYADADIVDSCPEGLW